MSQQFKIWLTLTRDSLTAEVQIYKARMNQHWIYHSNSNTYNKHVRIRTRGLPQQCKILRIGYNFLGHAKNDKWEAMWSGTKQTPLRLIKVYNHVNRIRGLGSYHWKMIHRHPSTCWVFRFQNLESTVFFYKSATKSRKNEAHISNKFHFISTQTILFASGICYTSKQEKHIVHYILVIVTKFAR